MGKRGPAPKPSALKKAQGTFRKSRAPRNEIQPTPGDPGCPPQLDAIGRSEWNRIVPELEKVGVLSVVDSAVLEGYCANYSLARQYQAVAEAEPMIDAPVYTKGGGIEFVTKPNPASAEARKHWSLVKQFAAEFGLTPSARTRVGSGGGGGLKPPETDPAEAFLFGNLPPALKAIPGGKSDGGSVGS
jgi:P27 family predicted phage terminase small subunit